MSETREELMREYERRKLAFTEATLAVNAGSAPEGKADEAERALDEKLAALLEVQEGEPLAGLSEFKCTEVLGWLRRQVDDYPAGMIGRSTLRKWIDAARDAHPALATPDSSEPAPASDIEALAERVHQAYLDTCARLGWPVKPENQVPYDELSEDSKELDRASVRAVLALLRPSVGGEGERAQGSEEGKALAYAFDAICPTLTYTDPMQAARLIVDAYLRTEAVAVAAHVAATPETGSESHA